MGALQYIYGIAAAILLGTATAGAQSKLVFDGTAYSFGAVREDGGTVSHTFDCRNTGEQPVVILSATSSCGCTVASFERKPVMPGHRQTITVTFDPMNRPGSFSKEISVFTSDDSCPIRLTVSGDVIPRQRSIDELYPIYAADGLRLEDNFHAFAYVEHGKSARTAIRIVNTSDKRLGLHLAPELSSGLLEIDCPKEMAPGGEGEIAIAWAVPSDSRTYGTKRDLLAVFVNGRKTETKISITGIVIDNRDDVMDNCAPKAELTKNIVKFGVVKSDDGERRERLSLANTGEAPLTVRAVEVGDRRIGTSLRGGETAAPGKALDFDVVLRPGQPLGTLTGRIRIITDDPVRPMRELRVTAIVEESPTE